jgi:hypothetical protein
MANAQTEVCLVELHAAMLDAIKAAFPDLQTVECYRDDRVTKVTTPACMLELTEMEAAEAQDPGTEQLAVVARFEARFILGFRTREAQLEARNLAAAFAAYLRKHPRWPGVVTGPAEVIGCYRDEFDPELDQYEVWRVEWAHVLHLGESVWAPEGITPTTVFLGVSPDTGAENLDKYVQIAPEVTE